MADICYITQAGNDLSAAPIPCDMELGESATITVTPERPFVAIGARASGAAGSGFLNGAGTYTVTPTRIPGGGFNGGDDIESTMPVVITEHPQSIDIAAGGVASWTTQASGGPMPTPTWWANYPVPVGGDGVTFTDIGPGEVGPPGTTTLFIGNDVPTVWTGMQVYCVWDNGHESVQSDTATLTVT
jgi:hypothetical protein